jgi:hypothetical protein
MRGGAGSTKGKVRNSCRVSVVRGRGHVEYLIIDGKDIIKFALSKGCDYGFS